MFQCCQQQFGIYTVPVSNELYNFRSRNCFSLYSFLVARITSGPWRCIRDFFDRYSYACGPRIAVAVIGGTVLLVGVAMILLPGPAFVVIPAGLGILGLEFAWARRLLTRVKERTKAAVESVTVSAE